MRITQVEYRKLVTHGEYSNTTIGAVMQVDEDEEPDRVLAELQEWVDRQLEQRVHVPEAIADRRNELYEVEYALKRKKADLENARAKFEQARALLERHGVELKEGKDFFDGMPF